MNLVHLEQKATATTMLYNTGEHRLLDIIQLKKDLINFKDIARKKKRSPCSCKQINHAVVPLKKKISPCQFLDAEWE